MLVASFGPIFGSLSFLLSMSSAFALVRIILSQLIEMDRGKRIMFKIRSIPISTGEHHDHREHNIQYVILS